MIGIHALMVKYLSTPLPANSSALLQTQYATYGIPPMQTIIIGFGLLVILSMASIMLRYHCKLKFEVAPDDTLN